MGAESISFVLKHRASEKEIKDAFKKQKNNDLDEYGHDPYNGSFSTVDSVKVVDRTFETKHEAYEYCLGYAEKWVYVIAVYFKENEKVLTLVAGWGAC